MRAFFMPKGAGMTEMDPDAYVFDPELEMGPIDAGRDAVGEPENAQAIEPDDAGCECDKEA